MVKHKRLLQPLLLVAGLCFAALAAAAPVDAQNVTTGYQSDETLQKGMIVRLTRGNSTKVSALPQTEVPEMLGVVVAASDAPVSLADPGAEKQVFVATYGQYDVLVSDQNGPIKEGDFITISSLKGVGMKGDTTQQLIIGKAIEGFKGNGDTESKMTLETDSGKKEVRISRIKVEISVAHNPIYESETEDGVPKFLARAASFVTDRPVTAFRIYASVTVLVICLIIAGSILFAGVRNGMIATGRNPLARHAIIRSLIQVTLMSLIVFAIGIFAVYLLLRI